METYVKLNHTTGEITNLDEKEKNRLEKIAKSGSPFKSFTQFNNEHTTEMMYLSKNYPQAMSFLWFLVDQMDGTNALVASQQTLAEIHGVSRRTIINWTNPLRDLGFIAVLKSGGTTVYTVTDKVFWKSWGSNVKYSQFPANVILSETEQDNEWKERIKSIKQDSVTFKVEKKQLADKKRLDF